MVRIHLRPPMTKVWTARTNNKERLDLCLARRYTLTRAQAQKLIREGLVLVNGARPKKNGEQVGSEDTIEIKESDARKEKEKSRQKKEKLFFAVEVVAETKEYLVINKPAGMLAHPTMANETGTVTDWLMARAGSISNVGQSDRPGLVHRLDKEASGLMVVAKNKEMYENLKRQFQSRTVEKEYEVLVYGKVRAEHDNIIFAIDRGAAGRMAARPQTNMLRVETAAKAQAGKEARTEFFVEKRFGRFTLLRVRIHTGRTHQIRVHMFAYGHPVVGDTLYVQKNLIKQREKDFHRLFLHAARLAFTDARGERVRYEAALPKELRQFLSGLN